MMEKRWRPEATGSPSLRAHPGQVMDRCCPDHRRTSGPLTHLYRRVTVPIWLPISLEPYEAVWRATAQGITAVGGGNDDARGRRRPVACPRQHRRTGGPDRKDH